jgi:lambda repressor-like predicted transcriptional regulator
VSVEMISPVAEPDPRLPGSPVAGSRPDAPLAGSRPTRPAAAPPGWVRPAAAPARQAIRPVAGVLADGTAFYAPFGEVVIVDDALVTCHLCGRALRSVTAHLKAHGWTKDAYCEAFGLERGQSLEGPQTRELRAAALTARLVFDTAVREGSAAGRDRARAGDLARDAAKAARGRPIPEQRRRKALRALAGVSPAAVAQANAERARRRLAEVATAAARRAGYPDIRAFVLARVADGASLAAISREAGLHKDWLSRHLGQVDPAAATAVRPLLPDRWDAGWRPALSRLGFPDVAGYLRERHITRHWTVSAIAAEAGLSHHAVASALRRHGLDRNPHAAKRHASRERAAEVTARLGAASMADYLTRRRADGWTWSAIAAESGQSPSWVRRQAAVCGLIAPKARRQRPG